MLKEGSAQLYRLSRDGRKFVFVSVPAGSVFGEMSCIGQGMYDCFAEAAEDSVICTMSRSDVTRLIHQHPAFAVRLLESVGRRVVHAERQLEDLVFRGLIPRLATFLLAQFLYHVASRYHRINVHHAFEVFSCDECSRTDT